MWLIPAIGRLPKSTHHVHEITPIHPRFFMHMGKPIDSGGRLGKELIQEDVVPLIVRRTITVLSGTTPTCI
jgi:hypothetical protein